MLNKSSKYNYVSSKVYEPKKKTGMQYQENNYYNNYNQFNQQQNNHKKKIIRPNSAIVSSNNNIEQYNNKINEKEIFGEIKPKESSMFDQYYKEQFKLDKNKDYKLNPNYNNIIDNNNKINNNQEESDKEQIKDNLKPIHRPPKETNQHKDYIETNKHLITKIQNEINSNKLKEYYEREKNPFHKEYGKTPKYIENMRKETEKKKEMEKLRKETAKYPKGTRLLSEEERLSTLEKLKQSKDDINKVIEKLPITCDSQAFRNKKDELFKKLDEIENAIETFSKKKVFVKVEN